MKRLLFILTILAILPLMACSKNEPSTQEEDLSKDSPCDEEFISMAYLSMYMGYMQNMTKDDVVPYLDNYRWEGISDIAFIDGNFFPGKDGTLLTGWNKDEWPPICETYMGEKIDEPYCRSLLVSKEVMTEAINFFRNKGIRIWMSVTSSGWDQGGSISIICENPKLIEKFADEICAFCREFGVYGVDFDWEFPRTKAESDGYRNLIKRIHDSGYKTSVCATVPTNHGYPVYFGQYMDFDEMIDNDVVDQIHHMQYVGFDESKQCIDLNVKKKNMEAWEKSFPVQFTDKRKARLMTGIGFYSYYGTPLGQLFDKYGLDFYYMNGVLPNDGYYTPDNVKELVRYAHEMGWGGVFTWLVTHDLSKEHPDCVSLQYALGDEVQHIWGKKMIDTNK